MLTNVFSNFYTGQTREVDLKVEMGQTAEKLYGADEKYKKLELELVNNFTLDLQI